eukprot:TRINITY_DN93360_c0_g1_i1.p1 TRINITY_DN93360_c0_g1~~TRINITY_DN93360_c0_g1_i1.p1  ORF type:complete len:396 (-),score=95.85 TRINITY_DN93360_c0_g1_i1:268-1455(-)
MLGGRRISPNSFHGSRKQRLACILLCLVGCLAVWTSGQRLSFCTSPLYSWRRMTTSISSSGQASGASASQSWTAAADASESGPAAFAAGGLATILALASASRARQTKSSRSSTKKTGMAAKEKEDWSLESLQTKHADEVSEIRKLVGADLPENFDDVKLLRYALQHEGDMPAAAANVKEVLAWRKGEGAKIVTAAEEGIAKATANNGWDNTHVLNAAPHSDRISKFITPEQMVVVSTKAGDLVTCIRASTIDSGSLMKAVSEEEMVEFFLYAREVNSIIAEKRTRATGHVSRLIAANDLTGVSSFPDQAFQNALTGSAKKAVTLYPGYSGPTVLLNLPWLARMLVSVLTPLFPGAVREKLKFARGPMAYMESLTDILKEPTKGLFVDDLQAVLNE